MKYLNLWLIIATLSVFLISCEKENKADNVNEKSTIENRDGETLIVGSYISGKPEITIPYEAVEKLYHWYFAKEGQNVQMENAYISDDPTLSGTIVYLIIEGTDQNTGFSSTVGFELERNDEKQEYRASGGRSWSCKGTNCSSCNPTRRWFLGRVTGCECSQGTGSCDHSTSGGDNSVAWVGVLIAIISILV